MFLLTLAIAITNVGLGYALAVYLGWASLPELPKATASSQPSDTSPGHGR